MEYRCACLPPELQLSRWVTTKVQWYEKFKCRCIYFKRLAPISSTFVAAQVRKSIIEP